MPDTVRRECRCYTHNIHTYSFFTLHHKHTITPDTAYTFTILAPHFHTLQNECIKFTQQTPDLSHNIYTLKHHKPFIFGLCLLSAHSHNSFYILVCLFTLSPVLCLPCLFFLCRLAFPSLSLVLPLFAISSPLMTSLCLLLIYSYTINT